MARSDPEKLAAALRENLRKRKEQARAHVPEPSHGNDEEGEIIPPVDASDDSDAWVNTAR